MLRTLEDGSPPVHCVIYCRPSGGCISANWVYSPLRLLTDLVFYKRSVLHIAELVQRIIRYWAELRRSACGWRVTNGNAIPWRRRPGDVASFARMRCPQSTVLPKRFAPLARGCFVYCDIRGTVRRVTRQWVKDNGRRAVVYTMNGSRYSGCSDWSPTVLCTLHGWTLPTHRMTTRRRRHGVTCRVDRCIMG